MMTRCGVRSPRPSRRISDALVWKAMYPSYRGRTYACSRVADGVRIEVPPACVYVGIAPGLPAARLPVVCRDEADLRVSAHQPPQVIEQGRRDLAASGDANPRSAKCRPGTAALRLTRRIMEGERTFAGGCGGIVHVPVHQRAHRDVDRRWSWRAGVQSGSAPAQPSASARTASPSHRATPHRLPVTRAPPDRSPPEAPREPWPPRRRSGSRAAPPSTAPPAPSLTSTRPQTMCVARGRQPGGHGQHLRRGVQRQRPVRARVSVAREARANGLRRPIGNLLGQEQLLQRTQAGRRDGLSDVGMIHHDQVIARAEISDAMRLESFERLPVPIDGDGVTRRIEPPRGRCERMSTTRMIPRQTAVPNHGPSRYSPIAPAATSASIRSSG